MIKKLLAFGLVLGFQTGHASVYQVPGYENKSGDFEMDFKMKREGNTIEARYTLPEDLVGAKNRVRASGIVGEDGIATLVGHNAELTCQQSKLICHAKYKNLNIDLDVVRSRLEKKGLDRNQIESGLEISRHFAGDPIGIIYFDSSEVEK